MAFFVQFLIFYDVCNMTQSYVIPVKRDWVTNKIEEIIVNKNVFTTFVLDDKKYDRMILIVFKHFTCLTISNTM